MLQLSIGVSIVAHLLFLFPLGWHGSYHFAKPVDPLHAVMVDLASPKQVKKEASPSHPAVKTSKKLSAAAVTHEVLPSITGPSVVRPADAVQPDPVAAKLSEPAANAPASQPVAPAVAPTGAPVLVKTKLTDVPPPLRRAAEFIGTPWERLTYRLTVVGLPVGVAVLEAKNERGEVRLSLSVKSRPPFSGIYPVDDLIETRHAAGNFIITKIRQREGDFRSNRGFTLFLRDKKVFWMDLLTQRSLNETVPSSDVLDLLSALYYLRNRPLKVGETETLHVYDSDVYAELPIQILRREEVDLPGLKSVRTLVVKPLLSTGGIFKRTGDITIWLTDDAFKAPVRVQTEIALGTVTADLVSAETKDDGSESSKTTGIKQAAATKSE